MTDAAAEQLDLPNRVIRRRGSREVQLAHLRAGIAAARGANRKTGAAVFGRLAGRLGRDCPALEAGLQLDDPAIQLIVQPELAARVFDAAAAALLADQIALAISPAQIETLPMGEEARLFALRHRHLSISGATLADYPAFRYRVVALWAQSLPAPLSQEFQPGGVLPALPAPVMANPVPESPQQERRWWQRRPAQIVLPVAHSVPDDGRPAMALQAALLATTQEVAP